MNKKARILVLGLDNAGRMTILSIGFNLETVQHDNTKFQVWYLGGETSIRSYWRCYFPNTQTIINVVDPSDTERLVMAKEEFHVILQEEELKGAVILLYANKQDLPGALDNVAITEALQLHVIKTVDGLFFQDFCNKRRRPL